MGEHHLGFATLAIQHGYTIVPVATVGMEDIVVPIYDMPLDKILTAGGLLGKPKKGTSKAFEDGAKLPMIMPKLHEAQRTYYKIMPPIHCEGLSSDQDSVRKVRDDSKEALLTGIQELLEHRESDENRYLLRENIGATTRQSDRVATSAIASDTAEKLLQMDDGRIRSTLPRARL